MLKPDPVTVCLFTSQFAPLGPERTLCTGGAVIEGQMVDLNSRESMNGVALGT